MTAMNDERAVGDHVYPVDDLIEHDVTGVDCPCGPRVEPVKHDDGSITWLISHHALDGRSEN